MILSVAILSAQDTSAVELGRNRDGSLEAVLTDASLQVQGATGEVAYLGATLEEVRKSWERVQTYSGVLTDDDADGQVEFAPEGGISGASVWIVLDLSSGTVLEVVPSGFVARVPKEAGVEVSATGRSFLTDREDLEFLLYRPGLGVWFGKGLDGGQGDDSLHANGTVRMELRNFRASRAGTPAPPSLRSGDRLLAIDLNHFDAISVTLQ